MFVRVVDYHAGQMAAAPLYLQHEVDALIAMAKRIPDDDDAVSQPRTAKQKKSARRRAYPNDEITILNCEPMYPAPGIQFEVEICHNLLNDSIVITLYGQIYPRPMRPICHYDVHDTPHENPDWFPPPSVESGAFHGHVYSEQAIRETDEDEWSACALPIDVGSGGSPNMQLTRLRKQFLADMNIDFDDRGTRGLFMTAGT